MLELCTLVTWWYKHTCKHCSIDECETVLSYNKKYVKNKTDAGI